ncbi:putative transcription factor interactor and regulator CCHC(Zn) family [Rosa chinensis]|uniref:Putative transcription factor interactor and regulator CCHC(Zn) family n=1 Tax=Rosa chinensis TaxID=74649 RepID=A0A2P6PPA7_ROSCH|nr:putative transcription factor interactor and regulator CCHC(Zn) family [Rosa chinensis]
MLPLGDCAIGFVLGHALVEGGSCLEFLANMQSQLFSRRERTRMITLLNATSRRPVAIYSNLIMHVNGMDLWSRGEGLAMLPPQYTRQPGQSKTKRIKDSSEMAQGSGTKLGRVHKSLKCGNCGGLGHNIKTCHRHLPPKEMKSATLNKRVKLNNGDGS